MSISKVKIAVLKNLLIFGEKYLPQSIRLFEGGEGGLNRYLAEFRLNMDFPYVGLPLVRVLSYEKYNALVKYLK